MQFWITLNITFPVSLDFKQVAVYTYKQQFLRMHHNIKAIFTDSVVFTGSNQLQFFEA